MFTLGYPFRPWQDPESIAGGADMLRYLRETAAAYGIDRQIATPRGCSARTGPASNPVDRDGRGHADRRADHPDVQFLYLSPATTDTTRATSRPGRAARTRRAGGACAALARWSGPHRPAGRDHRQRRDRVTLVPAIAEVAAQVTMLQRSPSFIIRLPARDPLADLLRKVLPERQASAAVRMEERAVRDGRVPAVPQVPGADAGDVPPGGRQAPAGRVRRGHALQARLRTVGPAPVPGPRR